MPKKSSKKLVNAKATLQKHSPTYLTGRKGQSLLCGAEYHNDIYAFLSSVKITDDQSLVGDTGLFIGNNEETFEITRADLNSDDAKISINTLTDALNEGVADGTAVPKLLELLIPIINAAISNNREQAISIANAAGRDEGATAYRDAIYNSGIENARDVINAYIAQQEEAAQNAQENQGGAAAQKVQENQEGKGVGTDDVPVVVNRDGGGHE